MAMRLGSTRVSAALSSILYTLNSARINMKITSFLVLAGAVSARYNFPGLIYDGVTNADCQHVRQWTGTIRTIPSQRCSRTISLQNIQRRSERRGRVRMSSRVVCFGCGLLRDLAGLLFDAVRRCSGVMWAGLTVVACAIEPRRFLGACDDVGELFAASCFVLFGVVRLFSL
jgi:hypothetical protein